LRIMPRVAFYDFIHGRNLVVFSNSHVADCLVHVMQILIYSVP